MLLLNMLLKLVAFIFTDYIIFDVKPVKPDFLRLCAYLIADIVFFAFSLNPNKADVFAGTLLAWVLYTAATVMYYRHIETINQQQSDKIKSIVDDLIEDDHKWS